MKSTLLVIDDELNEAASIGQRPRREYYDFLASHFDIVYLEELGDLERTIAEKRIDAVLIDFVLSKWGADARTILSVLNGRFPAALISSHWGPHFEDLRITLDQYKEDVAQLFTWEDLALDERRGLVSIWLNAAIRRRRTVAFLNLAENEPIRVLQISDLQFGTDLPEAFEAETELAAQAIRRHFDGAPHFVALTGDIAESGLPAQYAQAQRWIRAFVGALDANWSDHRFLVIPGNHDVCWPLGWSSRVDVRAAKLSQDAVVNSALARYAWSPFRRFAQSLGNSTPWDDGVNYWVDGRYRDAGLLLFGYNSCEDLDEWCKPTRKVVDKTLASLFSRLRALRKDSPEAVVFGLIHHPLVSDDASEVIINQNVFIKNLTDSESGIVMLTGHVHSDACVLQQRNGVNVLEITASTMTKLEGARPPDSIRGFNMIEIQRSANKVVGLNVTACRIERNRLVLAKPERYSRNDAGVIAAA